MNEQQKKRKNPYVLGGELYESLKEKILIYKIPKENIWVCFDMENDNLLVADVSSVIPEHLEHVLSIDRTKTRREIRQRLVELCIEYDNINAGW